ncbi:MAG: UDP-N-acetylglucosamine 4,6-dehydratase (inverting) [Candidatus Nealsonbacteria bacterium]|nr:UDP-N-acetylglucosamine 4,6-dehydratase (inverting) [Candidatus Nealsonbacteria bacterium]
MSILTGKTILVTGGTGSFGRKFVELALKNDNPKVIRVFSRDELKQFEMNQEFQDDRLRFFVGDVRDKERLFRAMNDVDIVIHAAALKQVPSCEYNPLEAVKTNIFGAQNAVDAAIDNKVERLMFLSSDKAVNPVNLYGATKLCAEKIFIQGNVYVGNRPTKISVVRYGNVVGSRGSVIPLFVSQKSKGVITLTDERMTRFWITQGQAVNFIIGCIEKMKGGEIFVPKIPSMKIVDLAKVIAPEARFQTIGIRPGEKISEVLLTSEEARRTKEFETYFIVQPEFAFWEEYKLNEGKNLPDDFKYASDTNDQWLGQEDLRKIIREI